jgi:hypothetical protein
MAAPDAERLKESLNDFLSCLICAAVYCEGPGWEGFREYLDSLSSAMDSSHLAGEAEKSDITKARILLKGMMSNDKIISFIISEVYREIGRAFN